MQLDNSDRYDNDDRPGSSTRTFELVDYLKVVRTYWLGAVLIILLGVAASSGWTFTQERVFTSTASALIQAPGGSDPNMAYASDQLAKSQTVSYVQLGSSLAVATRAAKALESTSSPGALLGRVHATSPDNTSIIYVTATGNSPTQAAHLADAWVAAMGTQITKVQSDGGALASNTTRLSPLASASVPSRPSSPNVSAATLLGALAGLVFAAIYLLVRNNLDRRIRWASAIESRFHTPVLGTVPVNPLLSGGDQLVSSLANDDPGSRHINFVTSEALRELRTNLSYVNIDARPRAIVVTSPQPGDGKSTIAANLAQSLAFSSSGRVVIIDCDLRRPSISQIFSVATGAGLTDVLSGRAELHEVMQQNDEASNLWVIGAGHLPPNPSELLGSQAMRDLVASLGEHATVILDAPPVLAVTDAVVLSGSTDGVLVVVSAKRTTYDQLGRSLQLIGRGGGTVLGTILNRVPSRGQDARDYGYYGGAYYYYDETDESAETDKSAETAPTR